MSDAHAWRLGEREGGGGGERENRRREKERWGRGREEVFLEQEDECGTNVQKEP